MIYKRYFPPKILNDFLKNHNDRLDYNILGHSVNNLPIYELNIGTGKKRILMWSQMHGNESTTTKALLDFIPWLLDSNQKNLLNTFTFYIIPQLNPDGAEAYTRLNANQFDLNRDAIELSQPESLLLRNAYDRITPDYALNLHGQRTIYSAGLNGGPATLSFLAPSADLDRSITSARKTAMSAIVSIYMALCKELPDGIGRYDDTFNPNCVGDTFTRKGTPTILFEAGHYPGDYQREMCRKFVFKALKALIKYLENDNEVYSIEQYLKIPKNTDDYVDLIVSNIDISVDGKILKNQQLAIQYIEELKDGEVIFTPSFHDFGGQLSQKAHRYVDLSFDDLSDSILYFKDKIIKNSKFDKLFSVNH